MKTDNKIFTHAVYLSDQEWLDLVNRSVESSIVNGLQLPKFPPEQFQINSVGTSGLKTLHEGFKFYSAIKRYTSQGGLAIKYNTQILDFGCGWGRMLRFFLKDVLPENLYGIDVDPTMVNICQQTFSCGNFEVCSPSPPLAFPDSSFDIIYAYSVFSHLSESVHIQWIQEFSRLLKPGGMVLVTTQPRRFLDFCRSFKEKTPEIEWHKSLANAFSDIEAAFSDYDGGKFLFSPTGGGSVRDASFYGEALIPQAYVQREWTQYLKFQNFIDDPNVIAQALIVMQKGR